MTPSFPDILTAAREFGVPVVMFVAFVVMGARGVLVWGRELTSTVKQLTEARDFAVKGLEAERSDRKAAEDRLRLALDAMQALTDVVKDIEREVLRLGNRPSRSR